MSEPAGPPGGERDPIERWLSSDVDLLPPPPGMFERVHRRARRRRAALAMAGASGAAVIIAAAVVLPQVAGNLLPGGTNPARINGSHTASGSSHTPRRGSPGPHPSTHSPATRPAALPAGPALSATGTGGRPPTGFGPTSVTFAGPSLGAVLGQAPCAAGRCTAVAGTNDYGVTWTRIGGPDAGPPHSAAGVSQIRFSIDQLDGWAYGPSLYATHDGGASWHSVPLHGRVIDLSTINGMTFAVVARCAGTGARYAADCTSFALYRTAAASDAWRRVPGAAAAGPAAPGGLQLTEQGGFLLAGGRLFAGPVAAGRWHQVGYAPQGRPACLAGQQAAGAAVIAPAGGVLYLACPASPDRRALTVYSSSDGGMTWQQAGQLATRGRPTSLAAIQGGSLVLATTGGMYYSADATTWQPASVAGQVPSGGFTFVGLTNAQEGVAIAADQGGGRLFVTTDGGMSWRYRPIS